MEENNLKICPNCKAVNEAAATVCRSCGMAFEMQNNVSNTTIQAVEAQPEYNSNAQVTDDFEMYEVTEQELSAFVGAKSKTYIPKFKKKAKGASVGWNWPVFLFLFFLGPVVAGFWFLHRRMNKIGAIIIAIGMVFTMTTFFISQNVINAVSKVAIDAIDQYDNDIGLYNEHPTEEQQRDFAEGFDKAQAIDFASSLSLFSVFSILLFVFKTLVAVLLAMFADGFYFKFACSRIKSVHLSGGTLNDISSLGGTKATGWIVCMIIYIVICSVATGIMTSRLIMDIVNHIKYLEELK